MCSECNYDEITKTLTLPFHFNKEIKDIPKETEIIIFSESRQYALYSEFNKPVDNLPENLTHLTFGRQTPVRLAHPKIMNIFIIV
jgi:hypothetical protein